VTDLVDGTEIWIMPSMNPDGTAHVQRWNANDVDLNRDFPDQYFDPLNSPLGREPETAAVMQWAADRRINLSANLHGGALVVNYPFDDNPELLGVYSPSPDQELFVSVSRSYADNHPEMIDSNGHPAFDDGITNGADWYVVVGGMQDWNYVWNGGLEVTLELGDTKWPAASSLPGYWDDNLESLLTYMERVQEGVRGLVTDAETGAPVAAEIRVGSNPYAAHTDPDVGDFHRPLLPGTYDLHVDAVGFESATLPAVPVAGGPAVRRDVALMPLPTDLQPDSFALLADSGGDGRLDPGDAADLAVTLLDLGATASGVTGRLEPTGWFGGVSRPVAAYPDLSPGGSGESLAPHHGIELSPDAPPGHKAGYAIRWTAGEASGVSEPFFVDTGAPACETDPGVGLPQPILDLQTLHHEIDVESPWTVRDVEVTVDLTHSYIGDLTLRLTSPSGTTVVLHRNGGGAADEIRGTYGVDLFPVEPLAAFAGEPASGSWSLAIEDGFSSDSGSLEAWSLRICGYPIEARPPEMRFRDLTASAGSVELRWWPYPGLASYRVYRSPSPSSPSSFVDVTGEDADPTDNRFADFGTGSIAFYLVTGVGTNGESPKGHFGE
jgi:subtilisin-like proprotein convertase family protein